MKKIFTVLAAMAAVFTIVSCNDIKDGDAAKMGGEGTLSISVSNGDIMTKASPSTTALTYESQINKLDYFIFESGNTLYAKKSVSSNITWTDGVHTETFDKLSAGTYTVIVVANCQSSISALTNIADVRSAGITLNDCSLDPSIGFVMYAEKTSVSVTGGTTTELSGNNKMTLTRFPARVRLTSVTNSIPSTMAFSNNRAIKVKGVFLTNVNSAWQLDASEHLGSGTNLKGRKKGKASSTNSADFIKVASDLEYSKTGTFKTGDSQVTVANSGTTTQTLNWDSYGFPTSAAIDGSPLRLVILAEVNGVDYYYPVTLIDATANPARTGIARNCTYEVSVSIFGTGSLDPDVPVARGAIAASVVVAPWTAGSAYSEEI